MSAAPSVNQCSRKDEQKSKLTYCRPTLTKLDPSVLEEAARRGDERASKMLTAISDLLNRASR